MKSKGALQDAGFKPITSSGTARRYRDTRGLLGSRNADVSYRAAFVKATGRDFLQATRVVGKYPEYADARDVRNAAKFHQFSAHNVMSVADENKLARRTLKNITKGHFHEGGGLAGLFPEIWKESPTPHTRPDPDTYPSGPEGQAAFWKDYEAYRKDNGPDSVRARFLVAIGRRTGDEEYAVGETP